MRPDMKKVVSKKPWFQPKGRTWKCKCKARRFKKIVLDFDRNEFEFAGDFGSRAPMRPNRICARNWYEEKTFGDRITPLLRWLAANRGRHWNDVYREFCENTSGSSFLRWHTRHHLHQHVRFEFLFRGERYFNLDFGATHFCENKPRNYFVVTRAGILT